MLSYEHLNSVPVDMDWSETNFAAYQVEEREDDKGNTVDLLFVNGEAWSDEDSLPESYLEDWGPMMNYAYPISGDPEKLAWAINGLPLCVVRAEDDDTYLALTGGGMDLTWEIARAYVRCGFAPPVHFCKLPMVAEPWTDRHEEVFLAVQDSLSVAGSQLERSMERNQAARDYMEMYPS